MEQALKIIEQAREMLSGVISKHIDKLPVDLEKKNWYSSLLIAQGNLQVAKQQLRKEFK